MATTRPCVGGFLMLHKGGGRETGGRQDVREYMLRLVQSLNTVSFFEKLWEKSTSLISPLEFLLSYCHSLSQGFLTRLHRFSPERHLL